MEARGPDLDVAAQLAETWIAAGFGVSVVHHILDDETSSTAKREMMFQLGNFQFATELAYSRLHAQASKLIELGRSCPSRKCCPTNKSLHLPLITAGRLCEPVAAERTMPVVPKGAVQTIGNQQYVFVATDKSNEFVLRPVKLAPESNGFYPVIEGLNSGDRTVVEGSFLLRTEWLKSHPSQ